jgi:hypothetical protein
MDGMRFVVPFHFHGTLAANPVIRYKLPCAATLVQVDTSGTANVTAALIVGTAADDDGYIKTFAPGANGATVTKKRGNFDGALNTDTAECPHIAAGTVLLLTYTHASAADVDIALTFIEG